MVIVLRKNQWEKTRKNKERSLILAKALRIELATFRDDKPLFRRASGGAGQFVAWADGRLDFDDEEQGKLEQIADFANTIAIMSAKENDALEIDNRVFDEKDVTPEFAAGFILGVQSMGGVIVTAKDARAAIGKDETQRQKKRVDWIITEAGLDKDLFIFNTVEQFNRQFEPIPEEVE